MTKNRIVVALGGNALGNTPQEQQEKVKVTADAIVKLIEDGNEVIVTHGNGPQVGMINKAFELASAQDPKVPAMPLPECGAMSQGYIGYHLQQAISQRLGQSPLAAKVASVVTQVQVDPMSDAFKNPTKPVGSFLTKDEADELVKQDPSLQFVEDSGRGYRQVVPSPEPKAILEKEAISQLVEAGFVVICSGGGGVPVIRDGDTIKGVPAVIDKDFAGELLAEEVGANKLCLLTAVSHVAINFNTPEQQDLDRITVEEAQKYCDEGQFAKGSMLPKVQAAMRFAQSAEGRTGVIGSLEDAMEAIQGNSGTQISAM